MGEGAVEDCLEGEWSVLVCDVQRLDTDVRREQSLHVMTCLLHNKINP